MRGTEQLRKVLEGYFILLFFGFGSHSVAVRLLLTLCTGINPSRFERPYGMLGIESGSTGYKANTQALVLFYFILLKFFGHSQWCSGHTLDSALSSNFWWARESYGVPGINSRSAVYMGGALPLCYVSSPGSVNFQSC